MKQMMRTYKTEDGKFITTDKAKFFINREVEKTPAYGKMTLFVCGIQDLKRTKEIANNNDIKYIYLGTGTTFLPNSEKDWDEWDQYIKGLLEDGVKSGEFPNVNPNHMFKALGGLFMGLVFMGDREEPVTDKDVEKLLNQLITDPTISKK